MDDINFSLGFSLAPRVGPKRFQNLLKLFGSAEKAWKGTAKQYEKAGVKKVNFAKFDEFRREFDVREYIEKLKKTRTEFIPFGDKYYPDRLKEIESPPIGLFARGNKKLLMGHNVIAVVGARKITSYGRQVTEHLVAQLSSRGFIIISGMALGVDGVAHQSAIQAQGRTLAVLGCGVDCPYPRENEKLYEEILDFGGLIISEFPLGMPANRGTFPSRNRIIAGISQAVLITEAAEDSGSLITVGEAIKQGKTVFAVPGPITSLMSHGTLRLLKQGAVLVSSAEDVLSELKFKIQNSKFKIESQRLKVLGKIERKVLEVLENEDRTVDEISKLTKIPITKLSIVLSEMEIKELIKNSAGKISASLI